MLQVPYAHLLRERGRDFARAERQEVLRAVHGEVVQAIVPRERVELQHPGDVAVPEARDDEREERRGGHGDLVQRDRVLAQRVNGGHDVLVGGVVLRAVEVVNGVQDDVEHRRRLCHGDFLHGVERVRRHKHLAEEVVRELDKLHGMNEEQDAVARGDANVLGGYAQPRTGEERLREQCALREGRRGSLFGGPSIS